MERTRHGACAPPARQRHARYSARTVTAPLRYPPRVRRRAHWYDMPSDRPPLETTPPIKPHFILALVIGKNACSYKNGGCPWLCLPTAPGERRCVAAGGVGDGDGAPCAAKQFHCGQGGVTTTWVLDYSLVGMAQAKRNNILPLFLCISFYISKLLNYYFN